MAKLVFERALKIDPDTGEVVSYWPERWPLKFLAKEYSNGPPFFSASYMNQPSAVGGNMLKRQWLHPYLPEQLIRARHEAGIKDGRGPVYAGVDTTEGSITGDYCAMVAGERVGPRLFLVSYRLGRWPVEVQAQRIEEWLNIVRPHLTAIEDLVARGYVYRAMMTLGEGAGTRWPFTIVRPTGAGGSKAARFMSMGARFDAQQVLIPGIRDEDGNISIDPVWAPFVEQWVGFPSGPDDILDAAYWAIEAGYATVFGAGVVKPLSDGTREDYILDGSNKCQRPAHVAFGQPISDCERCFREYAERERRKELDQLLATGELADGRDRNRTIGAPGRWRESIFTQYRRGRIG